MELDKPTVGDFYRMNKDNRIFDDVDISENISIFRDKEFDIGLDEIQNIRSIRFRVDYN